MMQRVRELATAACAALTLTANTCAWAGKTLPNDKIPEFAIPKMQAAPTIDGVINPEEWRSALMVSGAADQGSNELIPRPSMFYLGWDDGHFYFAVRTYIRAGYKPRIRAGRSQGLAYVWDDGLELHFQPQGQNVAPDNASSSYKLFLNCLGFVGDCSRLAMGQQYKNWNPQFEVKTRLTEPGSAPDGGHWWELEMSSVPKDFELTGPHQAGDQWKLMLGINHIPGWMQARIPCVGPYLDPFGYCVGTLVDDAPAVQFVMDSLENPSTDGRAKFAVRAYNPTAKPAKIDVSIRVADAVKQQQTLELAPGKSAEVAVDEMLPDDVQDGTMEIQALQGDRKLLTYYAWFKRNSRQHMLAPVKPQPKNTFSFSTSFNPVRNTVLVKGDTYYLDNPGDAAALRYRIEHSDTGKLINEGRATAVAEYYLQDVIKLPELQPGKYAVQSWIELKDGTEIGPMKGVFTKKNEAEAFAHWWNSDFGDIDRVLPPYTAMQRDGNRITCWGRTYEIDALGLPRRIESQDVAVSAAPARLVLVRNGQETVVSTDGGLFGDGLTFTQTEPYRVAFQGKAKAAGLNFTSNGWIEQDGLVYVELTYAPDGSAPVAVDAMRIEYPLSEQDADGLLCVGPGENYSSRTTMLLPKDKAGPLWSTLDTGITGSGMTVGSFYPTVWIGSERRGLLWWADNDQGWVQDDAVPAHDVCRVTSDQLSVISDRSDHSAIVFRNNIVAKPTELTAPRTIAFSYIATPFKPLVKGWRTTQATDNGTFFAPFRGVRKDSKTGEKVYQNPGGGLNHVNWIHPESRYPEEWPALWAEQKEKADAHAHPRQWRDPYGARSGVNFTHMSFQIMGYGRKTLEDHLYAYFGSEWEGAKDTWNKSYIDYAMYLFNDAFGKGGVRHTYWDLNFPIQFKDLQSGLCYRLPDGRVQAGYNGWNLRRFYMRLYALADQYGLNPGCIGVHSTNAYVTVAMPWNDAVLDGERNWNIDSSPLDWVDNMPIERMRSMSSPHSWGVPICWMANMDSNDKDKANEAKRVQGQWVWMHDSWLNPYIPQLRQMPGSVLDWGINDAETAYHPYWRNPFVVSSDKDVLVSLWQLPDRVMLGVFNYNRDQSKTVNLKIDLDKLGLVPELPWQQFVGVRNLWKGDDGPDASLNFHGRTLQVKDLKPHRLRLIGIRRY